MSLKSSKKIYAALYAVIIALFVLVRMLNINAIEKFKTYPDTKRYYAIASSPLTSKDFWAAEAPVVVPFLYRLLELDYVRIAWFQTIFAIFSWVLLAWVVSQRMDKAPFRLVTFGIMLIFSLSHPIILWDWVILSESISGSLMALLIASWIWLCTAPQIGWRHTVTVTVLGVLWVFTRDSNALIMLMASVFPVLFVIFWKCDKKLLVVSLVYLLAYWVSGQTADISGRWVGPNLNVVSRRILTDEYAFHFYLDHGMPDGDKLINYIGQNARPVDEGFRDGDDNELAAFHTWHRANGKSVFVKFLLSTPITTIAAPLYNGCALMDIRPLHYYAPEGFTPILPSYIEDIVFFRSWSVFTAILSLAIFTLGFAIAIGKPDPRWITPIILCLLIYPHAFMIWHASGGDVIRHAYQFRVHYRLTLWLFVLFAINTLSTPQALQSILKRWHLILTRLKMPLLVTGPIMILVSIFIDLISSGQATISIGYTQGAGIVMGILLIASGILVTLFPWKDSN